MNMIICYMQMQTTRHKVECVCGEKYRDNEKRKGVEDGRVDEGNDKGKIVQIGTEKGICVHDGHENQSDIDYPQSDDMRNIIGDSPYEKISSRGKFLEVNIEVDMKSRVFQLRMVFNSADKFRQAVIEYVIKNGKINKFTTNEKHKFKAVCNYGCDQVVYSFTVQGEHTM